jgi:hypothetical protein
MTIVKDDWSETMLFKDFMIDEKECTLMGYHGTDFVWIEWQGTFPFITLERLERLVGAAFFPSEVEDAGEEESIKIVSTNTH